MKLQVCNFYEASRDEMMRASKQEIEKVSCRDGPRSHVAFYVSWYMSVRRFIWLGHQLTKFLARTDKTTKVSCVEVYLDCVLLNFSHVLD